MALILLFESSTEVCSVALSRDGKIVDLEENKEGLSHSELLTSFAETILQRNKLSAFELDAVAVSKGPGSYTGLRIGVSAAKGMCYAAGKPLIAIGTLDAMANHMLQNPDDFDLKTKKKYLLCPMIDARRMEVYYTLINQVGEIIQPVSAKVINEDSFAQYLKEYTVFVFGNGAKKCKDVFKDQNIMFAGPVKASARFMAEIAEEKYLKTEFEDVAYFEPFYLKDFVATIPKNKVIK